MEREITHRRIALMDQLPDGDRLPRAPKLAERQGLLAYCARPSTSGWPPRPGRMAPVHLRHRGRGSWGPRSAWGRRRARRRDEITRRGDDRRRGVNSLLCERNTGATPEPRDGGRDQSVFELPASQIEDRFLIARRGAGDAACCQRLHAAETSAEASTITPEQGLHHLAQLVATSPAMGASNPCPVCRYRT